MRTRYLYLLLTSFFFVVTSLSAHANRVDDVLGWSSSPAPVAPAPTANPMAAPITTSDGYMPDPGMTVPAPTPFMSSNIPVTTADGYMPDPTLAGNNGTAAPAQPEVPQLSQADKDSQLWMAARNGDLATVSAMLQQGANINTTNPSGATPLHAATSAGSLPVVMYLIRSGANAQAVTNNGWTALHHAARFGRADIANYLRQLGLNPNQATSDGKTALQMALDNGDLRTARILGY